MQRFHLLGAVSLVALIAGCASESTRAANDLMFKHWTADNGNGTYTNPLFYEEFEDPDVIRVGGDYYLAGTTMHMNPELIESKITNRTRAIIPVYLYG